MLLPIAYEGDGRDGYCDVGVSLHSKTHPLFMSRAMAQAHSVMHITIRACFLCFFYNPCMDVKNFFIYLSPILFYLFETNCMFITPSPPTMHELNFLTYRDNTIQSVGLCIQYTNEICAPFCNSPNCNRDSSLQNVLTCNLALGEEAVATRFN